MVVKRFDRKLGRPKVVLKLSSGYSNNSAKGWVNRWAFVVYDEPFDRVTKPYEFSGHLVPIRCSGLPFCISGLCKYRD